MKKILKLSESLYVDLLTGDCRRTEEPAYSQNPVRITAGQLKILNLLVERRGIICSLSMLQGLVDSELSDFSTPGIKQQLNRMKNQFKKADPGFDKTAAKQAFHSISGVGYIFLLPEQGEVIETKTPDDCMVKVDMEFLKCQKSIPAEGIENLKKLFYGITGDKKVIMQAVCNDLHVSNTEYRRIVKEFSAYVFSIGISAGPVYLLADGGTGKSTLLCALAVDTAIKYPNWNVYFLDMEALGEECKESFFCQMLEYMCENGISRTRKTLLCIDAPCSNPEGFQKLYTILAEKADPYLYIVVAERTSFMLYLLESEYGYRANSSIRAFFIDNISKGYNTDDYFRDSSVRFAEVKQYLFPASLKKTIADQMIEQFSHSEGLDEEVVQLCCSDLFYDTNAVADVFLDFKKRYDYVSREEKIPREHYVPDLMMDWDEWEIKCRKLDSKCSRLMISEAFPYVAVCYTYGIPVTFAFLREMTGFAYQSKLLLLFPQGLGENIQFVDGSFQFRNHMVAENYFSCHRGITPQSCLEELIQEDYMDEKTIAVFVEAVFYETHCKEFLDIPYHVDYKALMKLFRNNKKCMEAVYKRSCRDYLEISRIALYYEPDPKNKGKGRIQRKFSESFRELMKTLQKEEEGQHYWAMFFNAALRYCGSIPEALLEFAYDVDLDDSYKLLGLMVEAEYENGLSMDDGWKERYNAFSEAVCRKFLEKNPDNIFAYKKLADLCLSKGQYQEAAGMYEDIAQRRNDLKAEMKLSVISCLVMEMDEFLSEDAEGNRERIVELADQIGDTYDEIYLNEDLDDETRLEICVSYAYYYFNHLLFDECLELLLLAEQDFRGRTNGMYRIYLALGNLHSFNGEDNPYLNLDAALRFYRASLFQAEQLEGETTGLEEILSILILMADAYYRNEQFEDALLICRRILYYKPFSQKAIELVKKINEKS